MPVQDFDPLPKRILALGLRVLVDGLSLALALGGMWVASSLAVFLNGPKWLAIAVGVGALLGPPLVMELWHRRKLARYDEPAANESSTRRLLFDTLRVNAVLAVGLMVIAPKVALTAISTRGDWMLESLRPEQTQPIRQRLFAMADRLDQWLDPQDNPFDAFDDSNTVAPKRPGWSDESEEPAPPPDEPTPAPKPTPPKPSESKPSESKPTKTKPPESKPKPIVERPDPRPAADPTKRIAVTPSVKPRVPATPPKKPSSDGTITRDPEHDVPMIVVRSDDPPPASPLRPSRATSPSPRRQRSGSSDHAHYVRWLAVPKVHHLVKGMPTTVETSYASVARYIANRESDPYERVKAIHDWVATRVDYQVDFNRSRMPPSDPDTVFRTRIAVCAGYTRLFKAMMESIGSRAVYISGEVRLAVPGTFNASHAWNGVQIEGRWYLLDVTWAAGNLKNGKFERKYRTEHLLAPPSFFITAHFPRDPKWQLLPEPMTHGEFLRQPLLLPRFHAYGFELRTPDRSQVTVDGTARIEIDNPKEHSVIVSYAPKSTPTGRRERCPVDTTAAISEATCIMPDPGEYVLYVFAAYRGRVRHELVARFDINNRG